MRERMRALPDGRAPYALTIDGFADPLVLAAVTARPGGVIRHSSRTTFATELSRPIRRWRPMAW